MKPIERLRAAVNFEDYDRPPFADNEWNEVLGDMVPLLSGCAPRADGRYSDAERARAVQASMDMAPWSHIFDHPRYPVLGSIPPSREGVRYSDDDGFGWVIHGFSEWVERRPFGDLPGLLAFLARKAAGWRSETPALPADFVARLAYARRMLGDVAIALPYMGLGLDDLYRLAGWDLLAQAVTEEPGAVADYLDALAQRSAGLVHLYAEHLPASACPVALIYSDIAGNTGLLLSPRFLRQALKPAIRRLTTAYHQHGIKVVYHSEGDLRRFVDDLVEAGVDGINPLSYSEHMDPVEIRRLYPRLILWGGINERTALTSGTPDAVRQEVRRVVMGVGRGLILGSTGGVHPACPAENCVAMVAGLRDNVI